MRKGRGIEGGGSAICGRRLWGGSDRAVWLREGNRHGGEGWLSVETDMAEVVGSHEASPEVVVANLSIPGFAAGRAH